MSEPLPHQNSSFHLFRRATPRDLYAARERLAMLGFVVTGEVKRPLATKDRKLEQEGWSILNAEWEKRWREMCEALNTKPGRHNNRTNLRHRCLDKP